VGDAAALGLLFARHRAGMHAVALALLGHSQDAEDAVQEAALIALRRIGDIRDPDAAGPWLRMVVRNACRAQLRKTSAIPVAEPALAVAVDRSQGPPDPAEVLDRHALRDWAWSALEDLSPGLRLVTMLRYFTDVTSYEDIAALCATPVGTVRSRLSQARAKLAGALLSSADLVHDDATALTDWISPRPRARRWRPSSSAGRTGRKRPRRAECGTRSICHGRWRSPTASRTGGT
jgi:RNA polymerase sigma-70 factor (ECF subfamily)